jgi:hypothetical protein
MWDARSSECRCQDWVAIVSLGRCSTVWKEECKQMQAPRKQRKRKMNMPKEKVREERKHQGRGNTKLQAGKMKLQSTH